MCAPMILSAKPDVYLPSTQHLNNFSFEIPGFTYYSRCSLPHTKLIQNFSKDPLVNMVLTIIDAYRNDQRENVHWIYKDYKLCIFNKDEIISTTSI